MNIDSIFFGRVISERELLLPHLERREKELSFDLRQAKKEKEEFRKAIEEKEKFERDSAQQSLNLKCIQINNLQRQYRELSVQITALYKEKSKTSIQTSLPIDWDLSQIKVKPKKLKPTNASLSEEIYKKTFQDENSFKGQVRELVAPLKKVDADCLPQDPQKWFEQNISREWKQGTKITVLSSVIIFKDLRKIMQPMKIRKDVKISDDLIEESSKHYVITEVVLGGIFLGIEKSVTVSEKRDQEETLTTKMSHLSTITCHCQGARTNSCKDLESRYRDWKDNLTANPKAGCPIAIRVKRLDEILEENGIISPSSQDLNEARLTETKVKKDKGKDKEP